MSHRFLTTVLLLIKMALWWLWQSCGLLCPLGSGKGRVLWFYVILTDPSSIHDSLPFPWPHSLSTRGMLAQLAFVSKVKAGISCSLVSLGLAEVPLLPGCQHHLIQDGSESSTEALHVLHWLLVGVGWGVVCSPFFSAESSLTTIDLLVGKLTLRLSYLLLPLFGDPMEAPGLQYIWWKKEGSLGEWAFFLTMWYHWALFWWCQSPISYGNGEPGPPGDLLPGYQIGSRLGTLCPNYPQNCQHSAQGKKQNNVTVTSLPLFLLFSAFCPHCL